MGRFTATFDGAVVAEPEHFEAGKSHGIQFPIYVNDQNKNRDTNAYEDSGDVTKVRVTLWNDQADAADIRKGDIYEVEAALVEKEYPRKDGGTGRQLQTKFVNGMTLKYRRDESPREATGFDAAFDMPTGFPE